MESQKSSFSTFWILLMAIMGSLVRSAYGFFHEPWNLEADHIAWEIVLKNGDWVYSDLIHYPHEGGSLLIGALAKFTQSITSFNSLAFVALVLDFLVRGTQILITKKIFGSKLSIVFGLFTIFAYPFIIPWGTVNFGLHSLSSIFPFLLLYLLHQWQTTPQFQVMFSLFMGLAIWFSYSNLILLPVAIFFIAKYKKTDRPIFFLILPFILTVGIHLCVRIFTDPGFHLDSNSLARIRGVEFELWNLATIKHLILVGNTLANASSISFSAQAHIILKALFILSGLIASVGSFKYWKSNPQDSSFRLAWSLTITFLISYGISPFLEGHNTTYFVYYRHLTYIFPLIALLFLIAFQKTKLPHIYTIVFIGTGIIGSILIIEPMAKTKDISPYRKSGWVFATKYGDQPEKIISLIKNEPLKDEIMVGVGWGTTSILFQAHSSFRPPLSQQLKIFESITAKYPPKSHSSFSQGVAYAFSVKVTPVLDSNIKEYLIPQ